MNEKLNLVEILKDCPEGTELYSTIFGEVTFDKIEEDHEYPIIITINNGGVTIPVASDGRHLLDFNGDCTLFPSKEQRDWSKFNAPWYKKEKLVEPKFKVGNWYQCTKSFLGKGVSFDKNTAYYCAQEGCLQDEYGCHIAIVKDLYDNFKLWTIQDAKDGDILSYQCGYLKNRTIYIYRYNKIMNTAYYVALSGDNDSTLKIDNKGVCSLNGYGSTARFATEEEKQKLFDAIKENGYKWNAETKTLEKLIQPKFKVGDKVRHKKANKDDVYEIGKVYDDSYGIVGFSWMIYMKYQDQYELIPNKFDPKTLQPFDKVLVRDKGLVRWRCTFYSHLREDNETEYKYVTAYNIYRYCIPYNDETKHLVGTTDEAPEYYRYWKD